MDPIEDRFRELMNAIAHVLDETLNPADKDHKKIGFTLLMFEFGTDGKRMNYISNAQRADMLTAMREFIAKHEGRAPDEEGHA